MFKEKNAQITIFVILAIVIVVGVIFALIFIGQTDISEQEIVSPERQLEKCIRDAVEPSINSVLENGGMVDAIFYKMYDGEKYNYLCYQSQWYLRCINQYPDLQRNIEAQIRNDAEARIENCFSSFGEEMERRGFEVSIGLMDYSIALEPGRVLVNVDRVVEISNSESSERYESFSQSVVSPLYDLMDVAREIVNQEAEYCGFDYNSFMLLYPRYDIDRIEYDFSRIYRVTDRNSGLTFKFAVRSCAYKLGI